MKYQKIKDKVDKELFKEELNIHKKNMKQIGKSNRRRGKEFEVLVRKDLESKGCIITKWMNQVELSNEINVMPKIIPAKPQYNPSFKRVVGEGSGFPDFICINNGIPKRIFKVDNPEKLDELKKKLEEVKDYKNTVNELYDLKNVSVAVLNPTLQFVECKINGKLDKKEKEKAVFLTEHLHIPFYIASKDGKEIVYEEFRFESYIEEIN